MMVPRLLCTEHSKSRAPTALGGEREREGFQPNGAWLKSEFLRSVKVTLLTVEKERKPKSSSGGTKHGKTCSTSDSKW